MSSLLSPQIQGPVRPGKEVAGHSSQHVLGLMTMPRVVVSGGADGTAATAAGASLSSQGRELRKARGLTLKSRDVGIIALNAVIGETRSGVGGTGKHWRGRNVHAALVLDEMRCQLLRGSSNAILVDDDAGRFSNRDGALLALVLARMIRPGRIDHG